MGRVGESNFGNGYYLNFNFVDIMFQAIEIGVEHLFGKYQNIAGVREPVQRQASRQERTQVLSFS